MYETYDIKDWFWTESATGRVYSSKEQGYLSNPKKHEGYQAFLAAGNKYSTFPVDNDGNESEDELRRMIEADGIAFLKPTPEQELEAAKADKKTAIDKRTDALVAAHGVDFDGNAFDMTPGAQIRWLQLMGGAQAGIIKFPTTIITSDNKPYVLKDAQTLGAFLAAVAAFLQGGVIAAGQVLKARVEACTSIEQVEAIVDDR